MYVCVALVSKKAYLCKSGSTIGRLDMKKSYDTAEAQRRCHLPLAMGVVLGVGLERLHQGRESESTSTLAVTAQITAWRRKECVIQIDCSSC